MFDFFAEISENTSQAVTIVNWGISYVQTMYETIVQSHAFTALLSSLSGLPSPIAGMIGLTWSALLFSYMRGH